KSVKTEQLIHIGDLKYVLDIAVMDEKGKTVGGVEIHHTHRVDYHKREDLLRMFGNRVFEVSVDELNKGETVLIDRLGCKRGECTHCTLSEYDEFVDITVHCDNKRKKSSRLLTLESEKRQKFEAKQNRKCATCSKWVPLSQVSEVECVRYEWAPGKVSTKRYACQTCVSVCPSCHKDKVDPQQLEAFNRCRKCTSWRIPQLEKRITEAVGNIKALKEVQTTDAELLSREVNRSLSLKLQTAIQNATQALNKHS